MKKKLPYNGTAYYGFDMTDADFIVRKIIFQSETIKTSRMSVQFFFIESGSGKIQINNQEYSLKKGSVLWLFSYHVYQIVEVEEAIQAITFELSLNVLMLATLTTRSVEQHMNFFEYWDTPALECSKNEFAYLQTIFTHALNESEQQERLYDLSLLADLYQVIVWFERTARRNWIREKDMRDLSSKILMYLHFHFRESLTLDQMAEKFKSTPQTINRGLKKLTGKTFGDILSEVRINNALAMLNFDELGIAFIADFVGYHSVPSFNKQFKRVTGYSPTEIKKVKPTQKQVNSFRFQNSLPFEIYTYINQHYSEPINVQTAAKYFYSSPTKIDQIVLAEFAMTFNALVEYNRMLFARSLLLSSSKKISEIAEACGYQSIRTFNRNFLTFWGNTPSNYKELITASKKGQ
ncbi:AraC family transcriptional regulator [Enterococcus rotai]|uniref:AraC family transcriptional regulator n=1 Tax=Enterococcus rotai TaxID=118060 RepID=UPI0035C76578